MRPPRQPESTDILALPQILRQGNFYSKPYTRLASHMRSSWSFLQKDDAINLINTVPDIISDAYITSIGFNITAGSLCSGDAPMVLL